MKKSIFLIGLPGVGKTTFGKQLAMELNIPFLDTDETIVSQYNLTHKGDATIHDIWIKHGEQNFRTLERNLLNTICHKTQIVSCGGGLPCFFDNIEKMQKSGLIIWLQAENEQIAQNISSTNNLRPLFYGLNTQQIIEKIKILLKKRIYFYNKAHYKTSLKNGYKSLLQLVLKGT